MKYRGCAYYPEYWDEQRWETDARLMKEAGINIARIGEFAWARMEPRDGEFTLDWLTRCIDVLAGHDVGVMMCTPTATPPAWLTQAHPDCVLVEEAGRPLEHGSRRHYCPTSPTYNLYSDRICAELAKAVGKHPNVLCWQLDNELCPESGWCWCEQCQQAFRDWLKERYGSLEELNGRWKTGFWTIDYSDWSQIRLALSPERRYSSVNLDSRRFRSQMLVSFAKRQTAVLRGILGDVPITTNGMGPLFEHVNYYDMFADLYVAADDMYFDIGSVDAAVIAMNQYRSYKPGKAYWVTETGSGALSHHKPPQRDQFNAWAWCNFAHGGEGHFIFRWRSCLSGQEQELFGMIEHCGEPSHRYDHVKRTFNEMRAFDEQVGELPLPEAPVALLADYEIQWGYKSSRVEKDVKCDKLIVDTHRQLYDRNIVCDLPDCRGDLAGYKLVILPSTMIITPAFAEKLKAYVNAGGVVFAYGQIGMRDENDNYHDFMGPEHLHDLLGLKLRGGMYLISEIGFDEGLWWPALSREVSVPLAGTIDGMAIEGEAHTWLGDVVDCNAEVLLAIGGDDAYAGQPAVTLKRTGKGAVLYSAAMRSDKALADALLDYALKLSGVKAGPATPDFVEVVRRGDVIFAINHTDQPVAVDLGPVGEPLLGDCAGGKAMLGKFGVCAAKVK